jgi:hypothetical protein
VHQSSEIGCKLFSLFGTIIFVETFALSRSPLLQLAIGKEFFRFIWMLQLLLLLLLKLLLRFCEEGCSCRGLAARTQGTISL